MNNTILIYSPICFLLLFSIAKISLKLNLMDLPSQRKIHSIPVAYTGGLAISIAYLFAIKLFDISINNLNLISSIAFLMALIGFIDDKYTLNTGGKLSLQIIPIFYLVVVGSLNLESLGNYNYFKLDLNTFSIPFTIISVLFLTNAFNYFDGVDGVLSFTSISTISILYFLSTDANMKLYLIIIILPVFIFLFFNFSILNLPKLFLGDSGSLLLGFIISFVLIYFANQKIVHPILLAWSVSIFVYEFISINLKRMMDKKDPFLAGLDHLHHLLLKKMNSVFLVNFLISFMNVIFFIIGYITFEFINPLASFMMFIFLFIIFFIIRKNCFSFKNL